MTVKTCYVRPQMLASGNVIQLDGGQATVESIASDWETERVEVKLKGRQYPVVIPMKRDLKVLIEDHLTPFVKVPVTLYFYTDTWGDGTPKGTVENGIAQLAEAFEGVKIVQTGEPTLVHFNDSDEEVTE